MSLVQQLVEGHNLRPIVDKLSLDTIYHSFTSNIVRSIHEPAGFMEQYSVFLGF